VNETAVSKFNKCNICGVSVHTGCRYMAKSCYPCDPKAIHTKLNSHDLLHVNCSGKVYVSVLHAYDMQIAPGTLLYGIVKLSSCQDAFKTDAAEMGDHDCVWEVSSEQPPFSIASTTRSRSRSNSTSSNRSRSNSAVSQSNRYLRHIVHPHDERAVFAPPFLTVELWKSFYGVFDSALAGCKVNLLPLLLHSNVSIERWFGLRTMDGVGCGMVLLRLKFSPDQTQNTHPQAMSLDVPPPAIEPILQHAQSVQINDSSQSTAVVDPNTLIPTDDTASKVLYSEVKSPSRKRTESSEPLSSTIHAGIDPPIAAVNGTPNPQTPVGPRRRIHISKDASVATATVRMINKTPSVSPSHSEGSSSTEISKPSPSENAVTLDKAQRSFASSASEWVRDAATRGLDVIEALSSGTSSASSIRRKRRTVRDTATLKGDPDGVGTIYVHLLSAQKSVVRDAAEGDYFAVVSMCSGIPEIDQDQERETRVVLSTATPCFNESFEFMVPHFRSSLVVTLVDAQTEKKVGKTTVSIYSILQRDADKYHSNWELAGADTYQMKDITGKECIGHFTMQIRFKEDVVGLFLSSHPRVALQGPEEPMSLERVRTHIRRFGAVISSFKSLFSRYRSLMDWENPPFTFAMLVLFVYFTLTINAEYALCCPLFLVVALLTESWANRHFGHYRKRWVEVEEDSLDYPYKPVAYLRIAVAGFRNFGLRGTPRTPPPYVRITLIPDGDESDSKQLGAPTNQEFHIATFSIDRALALSSMNRGSSTSGGLGNFISSLSISKTEGSSAKDALLHNVSDPWPQHEGAGNSDKVDISYLYPILQKICEMSPNTEAGSGSAADEGADAPTTSPQPKVSAQGPRKLNPKTLKQGFVPWTRSNAVVRFSFHGDNPMSSFVDNTWGVINVPVRELVQSDECSADAQGKCGQELTGLQDEVRTWRDILWSPAYLQRLRGLHDSEEGQFIEHSGDMENHHLTPLPVLGDHRDILLKRQTRKIGGGDSNNPQALLRMQLDIRQSPKQPSPDDLETSKVIQSLVNPKNEKSQTAISAIWNARDHIKYVQNILGGVLNKVESFKNIFNWTFPAKTLPIYTVFCLLWVASILIPGRYLILIAGLSEFLYIFMPQPEDLPMATRIHNLLESLPNDDDIAEVYRNEREENRRLSAERQRERLKRVKLRLVLDCQWDGSVKIKQPREMSSRPGDVVGVWNSAFLVVQGRRLVWWNSDDDIDQGNAPAGELLLQGHAGTTHASPVDIKEMGSDHRLVVVFGRDTAGNQMKRTILTKDPEACRTLKLVVNKVLGNRSPDGI